MNKKKTIGILFIICACLIGIIIIAALCFLPGKSNSGVIQNNGSGNATVHLADDHIEASGDGVEVEGTRVTVIKAGTYEFDGSLENGQIRVKTGATDEVTLVLGNISISNSTEEAIYVKEGGPVTLELKEGTVNMVSSGNVPQDIISNDKLFSEENISAVQSAASALEPDDTAKRAAIYSKGDLTVAGTGKIRIFGYIKNGIQAKNKLSVTGGQFEIIARNHGLKGNANFTMGNASAFIVAGNDGIHSDQVAEIGENSGKTIIFANDDGIQTKQNIHINGGELKVLQSDEGLEANQIEIAGGKLDLTANDDGMNACTAEQPDTTFPNINISGGKVLIHADGDGIDSNGNILVSGGEIVVDGPTNDGNGAIDSGTESNGSCKINGGTVIALGSSGMAETFEESSGQCSFLYNSSTHWAEGTTLTVLDSDGNPLYKYVTKKMANSIVFSSGKLEKGKKYTLQITDTDGKKTTETIEQNAVSVSAGEQSRFGGFGGGRPNGGFHPDSNSGKPERPSGDGQSNPGQPPEGSGKPPEGSQPPGNPGGAPSQSQEREDSSQN